MEFGRPTGSFTGLPANRSRYGVRHTANRESRRHDPAEPAHRRTRLIFVYGNAALGPLIGRMRSGLIPVSPQPSSDSRTPITRPNVLSHATRCDNNTLFTEIEGAFATSLLIGDESISGPRAKTCTRTPDLALK